MDQSTVRSARQEHVLIRQQMLDNPDEPLPSNVRQRFDYLTPLLRTELDERISMLRKASPFMPEYTQRNANRLGNAGMQLWVATNQVLSQLLSTPVDGRLSPNNAGVWLYPVLPYSGIDMVGGDFLLTDTRSGNFLLLDATLRLKQYVDKRPELLKRGLLQDSDFFANVRRYGVDDALFALEQRLAPRLRLLLVGLKKSPLNLLDVRLPMFRRFTNPTELVSECKSLTPRETRQREARALVAELRSNFGELDVFTTDLEATARWHSEHHHEESAFLLTDYATKLCQTGALRYLQATVGELNRYTGEPPVRLHRHK